MKKDIYKLLLFLFCLPFCGLMCSCSESDDTVEEFPDWQNKNETYFNNLFQEAQTKIANGDTTWKIFRCYSMPDANPNVTYTQKPENCIVVHVEEDGKGVNSPLYTDVARVHYKGQLLPSTSYPNGLVFDKSYSGELNALTAVPSKLSVNGVVDGFATALLNMHPKDKWTVYIPHQLGYGKTAQTLIPAYSTLIFEITMVDFYRSDADVPF